MDSIFVPGLPGASLKSTTREDYLMKSLKLIGLALGASLALSTTALAQDITIAVAGPMTGGESAFGRQMKNGAEQAVADINAAGGVLGKKLALQVGDDACDPKQARSVGGKVRQREDPVRGRSLLLVVVDPGVGSLCRRQRAADYAGLDQPAVHRAQAVERGARLRPRRPAGPGCRRLHRQELQGQERRHPQRQDHLRQRPRRRNQEGAEQGRHAPRRCSKSYNKGDKDFNAIVSRLKRDNIDLVFVGGYHQEAGLILRQMRDQGLKTVLMAGDALNDKEFASITGPAAEGTLFTFGPDPRNKPTAKAIVEKFKAKNIDPEGYTLYTYAAMQVWTQAVAKAKTTDPKKVMETIKAGEWDTVLGKMAFDAKGDIKVDRLRRLQVGRQGQLHRDQSQGLLTPCAGSADLQTPRLAGAFCFGFQIIFRTHGNNWVPCALRSLG